MTTTSATGGFAFRRNRVSVWRQIDPFALLAALAITTLGVIVVYSATRGPGTGAPVVTSFLQRQAVFAAGGVVLMGIVMAFDFRHIREILPVLYVGLLGLPHCWSWWPASRSTARRVVRCIVPAAAFQSASSC